jgi:metal-responsive CopG/Arc/MetJ family transcriptional regulator
MYTRPPASLRVATVLSASDVRALDAAAAREDLNRSMFIRRMIRARLREEKALAASEAAS